LINYSSRVSIGREDIKKLETKMKKLLIILGITGFLAACEQAPVETLVIPEPVSDKL